MFVCFRRDRRFFNSTAEDFWGTEDELKGVLSEKVDSWY